jgi:homoserine O-succinyltransferase
LYVSDYYEDIKQLWTGHLDGLIVTGTEPRARALQDEPYWGALAELVDQAENHAISTIWSCLAAHAAVLHIDGINRRPLREKLSGVFECRRIANREIVAGAPSRWCVPHSRYNDLPEQQLVSKGYTILSRSPVVGADMFVKGGRSLFIFLQGHPEYDPHALFREYRRDIRRFLSGERDIYPAMPCGYFDDDTALAFFSFRERAMRDRNPDLLQDLPQEPGRLANAWREHAVCLYRNWLSYLVEQHNRRPHLNPSFNSAIGVP